MTCPASTASWRLGLLDVGIRITQQPWRLKNAAVHQVHHWKDRRDDAAHRNHFMSLYVTSHSHIISHFASTSGVFQRPNLILMMFIDFPHIFPHEKGNKLNPQGSPRCRGTDQTAAGPPRPGKRFLQVTHEKHRVKQGDRNGYDPDICQDMSIYLVLSMFFYDVLTLVRIYLLFIWLCLCLWTWGTPPIQELFIWMAKMIGIRLD